MARRITSDMAKRRADLDDKLLAYGKSGPLESADPKDVVGGGMWFFCVGPRTFVCLLNFRVTL